MHTIYSDRHKLHATDRVTMDGHPFEVADVPARAEKIRLAVEEAGLGPVEPPVDHGVEPVLAVHDADYIAFLRSVVDESAAAYWSAQCALTTADHVRAGECVAYALCRPPGHHAGADLYGGFCYLNNAAVAACSLQADEERVAILDVDYHHGNGTQMVFYSLRPVLLASRPSR